MKKIVVLLTALSLMLCFASCAKKTDPYLITALTVGDYEISSTEIGYYFVDIINEWYDKYSDYASQYGLEASIPLNQQICDGQSGDTWAKFFLDMTKKSIEETYILYDEAIKSGYQLSAEQRADLDEQYTNFSSYAADAGFSTVDAYLQSMYGEGASEETYKSYFETTLTARSYASEYSYSLFSGYTEEELRDYEADKSYGYNSYSYAVYYLSADSFDTLTQLQEAAKTLTAAEITTESALNATIAEVVKTMSVAADNQVCTVNTDVLYGNVDSFAQEWIREDSRAVGDITYFEDIPEGSVTPSGMDIVLYLGKNDNYLNLVNVRHIVIAFEGGTIDSTTGNTVFSDTEKATALTKAKELLEQWKRGDATDESFGALADQHSADTVSGGLYENIFPGEMFQKFNDWCFKANRGAGDTDILESQHGYHIVYYVGNSEWKYRNYMVANDKRNDDLAEWTETISEGISAQEVALIRVDMTRTLKDILY